MKLHALRALDGESRSIAVALLLLVLALLLPPIELPRAAYDYLVVLDITQSMSVEDAGTGAAPASRLAQARQAVRRSMRELPCGSRIGLAVFAEYRTLMLLAPIEVCANYHDLSVALDNIDGRMRWGNASEIAKGVYWSIRVAREADARPDVIFLTDGHEAPPLDITNQPAFDGKPGEVRGWLIGVGGDAPRPIPRTDPDGRPMGFWRADEVVQVDRRNAPEGSGPSREHLSSVREPHLRMLARQVGFDYTRLRDFAALSSALREPRYARRRPVRTDLGWLPATLALLLLVIRHLPERRHIAMRWRRAMPRAGQKKADLAVG